MKSLLCKFLRELPLCCSFLQSVRAEVSPNRGRFLCAFILNEINSTEPIPYHALCSHHDPYCWYTCAISTTASKEHSEWDECVKEITTRKSTNLWWPRFVHHYHSLPEVSSRNPTRLGRECSHNEATNSKAFFPKASNSYPLPSPSASRYAHFDSR